MHPILLKLGPFTLYSYGVMLVIAFMLTTWLASRAARRLPNERLAIHAEQITDFTCLALLGGIMGARLLYVGLQWDFFRRVPQEIPAVWHGGLVWYGGFLGGVLAGWLYLRAKQLVFLRVMDQFIPFLALGHAIGRIGCFLNGCCYGRPTTSWYGVVFPGHAVAVLPTQLFEAAGLFLLYSVLRVLQRSSIMNRPGALFGLYLVGYAGLRFLMEFLRGDQVAWWAGLTLQQLISIGMLLAGLAFFISRQQTVHERS